MPGEFLEWLLDVIVEPQTTNTGFDAESDTGTDDTTDPLTRQMKNLVQPVTNESKLCHRCHGKRVPTGFPKLLSHWPGINIDLPPQQSNDDGTAVDVEQLLADWFKNLGENNYLCDDCDKSGIPKAEREAIARTADPAPVWRKIERLPEALFIRLIRWQGGAMVAEQKNTTPVEFSSELIDLARYMQREPDQNDDMDSGVKYRLVSVVSHRGELDDGHYINYSCVDGQWFEINNHRVRRVVFEEVVNSDFLPYILLLQREVPSATTTKTRPPLDKAPSASSSNPLAGKGKSPSGSTHEDTSTGKPQFVRTTITVGGGNYIWHYRLPDTINIIKNPDPKAEVHAIQERGVSYRQVDLLGPESELPDCNIARSDENASDFLLGPEGACDCGKTHGEVTFHRSYRHPYSTKAAKDLKRSSDSSDKPGLKRQKRERVVQRFARPGDDVAKDPSAATRRKIMKALGEAQREYERRWGER
jgi:hypothetical protein